MNGRKFILAVLLATNVLFTSGFVASQSPADGPLVSQLTPHEEQEWNVFGHVTMLNGEPVPGAKVTLDIGVGRNLVQTLETNLKGDFELPLNANLYKTVKVKLVASKTGYLDSTETVDFGSERKPGGIDLVLRENEEDASQLALATLISNVGPRLLAPAPGASVIGPERRDYLEGAQQFLNGHQTDGALSLLAKAVEREPNCVECRTLFGLALLKAGSWCSAIRQLTRAATLNTSVETKGRIAEPSLILGVLECWRGHPERAVTFFSQALEVEPANPLVLQELGRALVFQENWEAADQYLAKAISRGAAAEAHLLRARALLAEGKADEADAEMDTYLAGRKPKELPVPIRATWSQMKSRVELESEGTVSKSLVDKPLAELMQALPELKGLQPAQTQHELAPILRKVGEGVETFFRHFVNTSSLEEIRQERLHGNGKVGTSLRQDFQYLLLAQREKSGLGLEEYRTDAAGARTMPRGLEVGFMLTAGFASASLHFHPAYQSESTFRYLGRQRMEGRETYVVAFAQRPQTARLLGTFSVSTTSAPTLTQGVAWVDCDSYQIIRMRTDLLRPLEKFRLDKQTTEIRYGEVHFKDIPSPLWLPRKVAVTVKWKGKILRNWHTYSGFKLFHVESHQKPPKLPSEAVENPN